jgi:hypothetical protein
MPTSNMMPVIVLDVFRIKAVTLQRIHVSYTHPTHSSLPANKAIFLKPNAVPPDKQSSCEEHLVILIFDGLNRHSHTPINRVTGRKEVTNPRISSGCGMILKVAVRSCEKTTMRIVFLEDRVSNFLRIFLISECLR